MTPPSSSSNVAPGRLMSNERATNIRESASGSRSGVGISDSMASMSRSRLTSCWAETGTMGASSATVPSTNSWICS